MLSVLAGSHKNKQNSITLTSRFFFPLSKNQIIKKKKKKKKEEEEETKQWQIEGKKITSYNKDFLS